MPTNRKLLRRSHRTTMTHTQQLELWLGPGNGGSSFESDDHRHEVWFRYRDELMRQWGSHGRRPLAWWQFEAPEKGLRFPGYAHERSALYEFTDILSAEERAELEAGWRREFDRSFDEHFFVNLEPGKICSGEEARWRHWLFVDLPPPLVDKWLAEREQRGCVDLEPRVDLETEAASADAEGEVEPRAARAS